MRALTVAPGIANSARVEDVPEPPRSDGAVLVRTLALGVCGTDREIVSGTYGWAPPGEKRLVIGHESLGEVCEAPAGQRISAPAIASSASCAGPIRCRAPPAPSANGICAATAAIPSAASRNATATARIFSASSPNFLVKVDRALGDAGVLVEPTSVVAKAWDHTERIGRRSRAWQPQTLLVTGAGPIGLLAALMGAQRGLDVHVLDHHDSAEKRAVVHGLGATFHLEKLTDALKPDILMECTGAPSVVRDALGRTAPDGIVCLVGVSSPGHDFDIDVGGLNRTMVLDNDAVFGSVNANRRHYEDAVAALERADPTWLARLLTRRVPVEQWTQSLASPTGRHQGRRGFFMTKVIF